MARYASSPLLNSSASLGVGLLRYLCCLSSVGMMLKSCGALLKNEAPLTVDTQAVAVNSILGVIVIPFRGSCSIVDRFRPGFGYVPIMILVLLSVLV